MTLRASLRLILAAVFTIAALFALTLALPVEAWRRGEPAGPPLDVTVVVPGWPRSLRVWVDTDAACGHSPHTDPDDCFALLLLARSPEVEIVGVSTVFGNAALEVTDSTTRALAGQLSANDNGRLAVVRGMAEPALSPAKGPITESAGAEGPSGGAPSRRSGLAPAHTALARALEQGPLVILGLGPLTNLATLLRDRPDLRGNVMRIVAVIGRRKGHLFHPVEGGTAPSILGHGPVFRDFNFAKDPDAALALLDLRLPLTLIPYEAAREIAVTGRDLDRLTTVGGATRWVAARARGWLNYWEREIGRDGFYPFDLVAAGYVVRPDLYRCAPVLAWVGQDAGILEWFGRRGLFVRPPEERKSKDAVARPALYCPELVGDAGPWFLARLTSSLSWRAE